MQPLSLYVLPLVVAGVLLELAWSRRRRRGLYSRKESLASVGTAAINQIAAFVSLGWKYLVLGAVGGLVPWSIPLNVVTVVVGFVGVEFCYYWYHRLSHEVPALWAMHFVHHSSPEYNLLVAPRLSAVANFVSPIFFVPLALLGFSPEFTVLALSAGLLFQFFLHTQTVGRIGPLEGTVNTPSAHRVHHGTNPQYIDRNYGSTLMIFDRLFGTYEPEGETVRYGVTSGHWGYNPLRLQFAPIWQFLTGRGWTRQQPTEVAPVAQPVADSVADSVVRS
jgi:sterol desaturase/sphingolipid hydroxylase (fatty acid hydroxylase superfamily)